jgi:hypothetical protein
MTVSCVHCGASVVDTATKCAGCGRMPAITGEADALLLKMAQPKVIRSIKAQLNLATRVKQSRRILLEIEDEFATKGPLRSRAQRRRYEKHSRRYLEGMIQLFGPDPDQWPEISRGSASC